MKKIIYFFLMIGMFFVFSQEQAITNELPYTINKLTYTALRTEVSNSDIDPIMQSEECNYGIWAIESKKQENFIFDLSNSDVNTSAAEVSRPVQNIAPIVFKLGNAFPNPFNPTTTVPFSLAEQSKVSLIIFSITGQKVRELITNDMAAGVPLCYMGRER